MGWRDTQRRVESGELSFAPSNMDSFASAFRSSFSTYYKTALENQTDLLAAAKEKETEDNALKSSAKRLAAQIFPENPDAPEAIAYAYNSLKDYDSNYGNAAEYLQGLKDAERLEIIPANPEYNFLSEIDPNGLFSLHESGAGGYDALFNQSQNDTFSGTVLTEMTVAEVLDFGAARGEGSYYDYVKQNLPPETQAAKENKSSTPVGQFQFINSTLNYIKQNGGFTQLDITDGTVFDEKTQNDLFVWYANDQLSKVDKPSQKRKVMRSVWEGFRKKDADGSFLVSDNQLDKMVEGLETGTLGTGGGSVVKTREAPKRFDFSGKLDGITYDEDGLQKLLALKAELMAEAVQLTPTEKTTLDLYESSIKDAIKEGTFFKIDEFLEENRLTSKENIMAAMMVVENMPLTKFREGQGEQIEHYVYLKSKLDQQTQTDLDEAKQKAAQQADEDRDPFVFYEKDKTTGLLKNLSPMQLVYKGGKFYDITDVEKATPIDTTKGKLIPQDYDAEQFIKIYNKPLQDLGQIIANGDNTIDNLLAYRQLAYENPAAFNRTLGVLRGAIDISDDLMRGFKSAVEGGLEFDEVLGQFRVIDNFRDLTNAQKVMFTLQLQAAYDLARLNGSTGQGLSDNELDLNLKKVGYGALTAEEALLKINEALKATEGRTESQRKGILKGIIGDKDYIDFLGTQGFTTPFAKQTTDRVSDASFDVKAKEQYDLYKAGDNSVLTNTSQLPLLTRDAAAQQMWDNAAPGTQFRVIDANGNETIKTKP
jgi:hypothetical protein